MKNLLTKILLAFAILMASITISEAQLIGKKKMNVGVKTYSYFDPITKYQNEFKDFKGSLDKYNFYNLPSEMAEEEICIVFDRKQKLWRLPLSSFEAEGIAEKDGEEPLRRAFVKMGIISPAIREKIE